MFNFSLSSNHWRWRQEIEVFICCYCYWNCEEVSHLLCLLWRILVLNFKLNFKLFATCKSWFCKNLGMTRHILHICVKRNTNANVLGSRAGRGGKMSLSARLIIIGSFISFHDIFPTFYSYYGWKEQSRQTEPFSSSILSCNDATNSFISDYINNIVIVSKGNIVTIYLN